MPNGWTGGVGGGGGGRVTKNRSAQIAIGDGVAVDWLWYSQGLTVRVYSVGKKGHDSLVQFDKNIQATRNVKRVYVHVIITRAGRLGFGTRFCVECACSMRKVQGSSPSGGTKHFAFLWLKLFFHSLKIGEKVKNDEKRTNHKKLLSTHRELNPGPLTLVGALWKGHY